MSVVYYITGASKGLGKAIAEAALKAKGTSKVVGLARSQIDINDSKFTSRRIDLSSESSVREFEFESHEDATKIVFVNNAGTVGPIGYYGEVGDDELVSSLNLNVMASALLMNKFLRHFQNGTAERFIIHISSGAARRPMENWAAYCSGKAAIEMMVSVIDSEIKARNDKRTHVFSVAPGVVDTEMQGQIRSQSESNFRHLEKFQQLKDEGQLYRPEDVASRLLDFVEHPQHHETIDRITL